MARLAIAIGVALTTGLLMHVVLAWLAQALHEARQRRRLRRCDRQLPDALRQLAAGLRSGVGLGQLLPQLATLPAPLGPELAHTVGELRLGVGMSQAMARLRRRLPSAGVAQLTVALGVTSATGGGLTAVLERSAAALDQQHRLEDKVAALSAQGRLQAWVLGLMPVAAVLLLVQLDAEVMALLWRSRAGLVTLALSALLLLAGVRLVRKISRVDV